MSLKATLRFNSPFKTTVRTNSSLGNYYTIKAQNKIFTGVGSIPDVDEVNLTNGATLVYNASSDRYEVKPLNISQVSGDIDLGTF